MSKVYTTVSLVVRMGVGVFVFTILARSLGAEAFGGVALVIAYSALAALVGEFGLSMKSLRDIAHFPEQGGRILQTSLRIKLYISAVTLALAAIILAPTSTPLATKIGYFCLVAGVVAASIGDLSLSAFRATGRFKDEMIIAIFSSALYAGLVTAFTFLGHGVLPVAVGFVVSRAVYAAAATLAARRILPPPANERPSFRGIFEELKKAWPWAAWTNLAMLNAQIDGFLLAHFLGVAANGIYQSGARFALSAISFANIIVNTQVPRIAAARANGLGSFKIECAAWLQLSVLGLIFGGSFIIFGPLITQILIGPEYLAVNALWPGFAGLILCRFINSAIAVSLAGLGLAKGIAAGELLSAVAAVSALPFTLPAFGLAATAWTMCGANLSGVLLMVAIRAHRAVNDRRLSR